MSTPGHATRFTSRAAIGDTFLSLSVQPSECGTPTPGSPPRNLPSPVPEEDEPEAHVSTQEPVEPFPIQELDSPDASQSLAKSLELLANKLDKLPEGSLSRSHVKP